MTKNQRLNSIAAAALLAVGLSAHAQLQSRDVNADGTVDAFYDTQLDLTWLADMDYANTVDYAPRADGLLNLNEARVWADTLTYFGATDWRLPNVTPVNGTAFNYATSANGSTDVGIAATNIGWGRASELGHLFYVGLGNTGQADPYGTPGFSGVPLNVGSFRNLTSFTYWSGPAYGQPVDSIQNPGWDFDMWDGSQDFGDPQNRIRAVAVHGGDVFASAVPEPSTYALMLLGLAMVGTVARRRRS